MANSNKQFSIYFFLEGLGFRVYRNCIGFGSGVLGGFAGFCRVLPGFAFAFVFWAPGCGLVLPGFAFAFVFWAPGGGLLGSGLLWALRTG